MLWRSSTARFSSVSCSLSNESLLVGDQQKGEGKGRKPGGRGKEEQEHTVLEGPQWRLVSPHWECPWCETYIRGVHVKHSSRQRMDK